MALEEAMISGPQGVTTYQALVIKHGLKLYLKTGLKPNTMWTISNMLKAASGITGYKYKRSQALEAIADLDYWLEANGRME
jgi:hypothetical protein